MASGGRYAGKVVIVTGGGRGIGAGIVRAFVDSGAQVVICDKDEPRGRALEQELRGAVFMPCDMTREEEVRGLVAETVRRFGRLDCVVNNAGYHTAVALSRSAGVDVKYMRLALWHSKPILYLQAVTSPMGTGVTRPRTEGSPDCSCTAQDPPPQRIEETTAQGFRDLLELNLLGAFTLCKLALPHLRKSQGNIINISSLVGALGQPQALPYVATKGAVTAMTKALALDESQYGVRVNCISPGNIWTPLWQGLAALAPDPMAAIREGAMTQPLGRMGQPAEVGAAALFLASEASFCTGIELFVTGGAELGYACKASPGTPVQVPTLPP